MHRVGQAKSAAERQHECRARKRANPELWKEYLASDRNRKKEQRLNSSEEDLREMRKHGKLATQKWRLKTKVDDDPDNPAFKSPASLAEATYRAKNALPKSPAKARAVVKKLAENCGLTNKSEERTSHLALSSSVIDQVVSFYHKDDISSLTAGKNEVVIVRNDGNKTTHQKRYMIMTISEAFQVFKEDFPNVKVGLSKFDVLLVSFFPQYVCGCLYHSNVILKLDALTKCFPQCFPLIQETTS
jgi:hypothetical protein